MYVITINEPAAEVIPGIMSVAFSPDGQFFATAIRDRTVRLWNTKDGEQITLLSGHDGGLRSVAISRDGKLLVSGHAIVSADVDGKVSLLDVHTGTVIWETTAWAGDRYGNAGVALRAVTFSPQGDVIACGGDPGNPHLFDAKSGKYLGMLGR